MCHTLSGQSKCPKLSLQVVVWNELQLLAPQCDIKNIDVSESSASIQEILVMTHRIFSSREGLVVFCVTPKHERIFYYLDLIRLGKQRLGSKDLFQVGNCSITKVGTRKQDSAKGEILLKRCSCRHFRNRSPT